MNMQYSQKNNPKRQSLIPADYDPKELQSAEKPTLDNLKKNLQIALELEHSTIPPYLCALYSIKDGTNTMAAEIIKSVVLEEMLHMVMVANLINAIGGEPVIGEYSGGPFIPDYPTHLPGNVDPELVVNLSYFSKDSVKTFWKIEHPVPDHTLPKKIDGKITYPSIGVFYQTLEAELIALEAAAKKKGSTIFTGKKQQVGPEHYYGAGGKIIPVHNLDDALAVIAEIVGQGEGSLGSIFAEPFNKGDNKYLLFGEGVEEYAHYFRFKEVFYGRLYDPTDSAHRDSQNKGLPTGEAFELDWDAVYKMRPNPKMKDYPKDSELYRKTYEFNKTYMALLKNLNDGCNGKPEMLRQGIPLMYDLKYKAVELMKIPVGDGYTAGPSFEYVL